MQYVSLYRIYVLRDRRRTAPAPRRASVSVIVPTRNEAGNVAAALARTPVMGSGTELIFVEGHSTDDTWATIQTEMTRYSGPLKLSAYQQTGKGKGDAVRLGFGKATGDILMILDADLTMPPEELPSFYDVIASGQGDFVQGTRLVYPMEPGAMRFFNKLGNVAFSQLFTYLLQQPIKDTLCGTKVLWRARLRADRGGAGVLRRLRSVRRLRPDLRRRAPEPEDRRDSGPLPRAHLRHDQHRPLAARLAAAADVGDRRPQDQVRVSADGRKRRVGAAAPLTEELRARTLERFERHRRAWAQNRALRALNAELYARVAAELPPRGARPAGRARIGAGLRARHHPRHGADRSGARAVARSARPAPRRCRSTTAASARSCCSTCSITCRRRARFFAEAVRVLAPGGRIVMCEPYISPVS